MRALSRSTPRADTPTLKDAADLCTHARQTRYLPLRLHDQADRQLGGEDSSASMKNWRTWRMGLPVFSEGPGHEKLGGNVGGETQKPLRDGEVSRRWLLGVSRIVPVHRAGIATLLAFSGLAVG